MKAISFLLGVALLANDSFGQSYLLTDLAALLGTNSYAQGINNDGQVVGYWESTNGAHAFLYQSGTVTDLGLLGGAATNNFALSINNSGQVVGFSETTNGAVAFVYQNGCITNLGGFGGWDSYAFGINDGGQIVGHVATGGGALAFLYNNGIVTGLGTLGGSNSFAYGVNNALQVAGSSLKSNNLTTHAFLWQNGVIRDLNQLLPNNSGWELMEAHGINDFGSIAGWGMVNQQAHAFLYYNGGWAVDLGTLPGGTNSYALGLNRSNVVVGVSSLASGSHAVLWSGGTVTDLNSLINDASWELKEATGINDAGQIVGWGISNGLERAFLIQPAAKKLLSKGISTANGVEDTTPKAIPAAAAGQMNMPPVITQQPANVTNSVGSNAIFSVVVSTNSTLPLSYQWLSSGTNLAGATSATLMLTNVQLIQSGNYAVLVTNAYGSVLSSNAVLTVEQPPVITSEPTSRTIWVGDTTEIDADATGSPLYYQWYINGEPAGYNSYALFVTPDSTWGPTNFIQVLVYNDVGQVWSSNMTLTVLCQPQIRTAPACTTAVVGGNASFNATVTGAGTLI